jgi:methionyl-tRNA formyltransferase
MRIVYLGNNLTGLNVLKWLVGRNELIVGLAVHPDERAKYKNEIITTSGLKNTQIFNGNCINRPETVTQIRTLQPDIILSVFFGYRLGSEVLNIPPQGCINLHPAYLPFNRGVYPNVWAIIDGTPAGVTLHYMDEGFDTGDIIAQKKVPVNFHDTGESLYHRLEHACVELFKETWPEIKSGKNLRMQQASAGIYHSKKDVEVMDRIDLDRDYKSRDLINILRARTFYPYRGAFVEIEGKKIFLHLELKEETQE